MVVSTVLSLQASPEMLFLAFRRQAKLGLNVVGHREVRRAPRSPVTCSVGA